MKINEIILTEADSYPGLGLTVNNHLQRMAGALAAAKASYDPETGEDDSGRIFSSWVNNFYIHGKRQDKEGQAGAIQYLVKTAQQNGWKGNSPDIMWTANKEGGTPKSEIFSILKDFYGSKLPEILKFVPEIGDEEKKSIASRATQLAGVEQIKKSITPKRNKPDDDYVDSTNNGLRGSQNSAAMMAVNGALDQVAQKYGKDQAHQIRQKVQRSGNPIKALQVELQNAGLSLSESVIRKLKEAMK